MITTYLFDNIVPLRDSDWVPEFGTRMMGGEISVNRRFVPLLAFFLKGPLAKKIQTSKINLKIIMIRRNTSYSDGRPDFMARLKI
jgi:hypothetical protein